MTGAALSTLVSVGVLALYLGIRRAAAPVAHVPVLSPLILTTAAIWLILARLQVPVARFEALTGPIRWMMGPAIVALGAVVRSNWPALRAQGGAAAVAIAGGAVAGVGSALLLARALGLGPLLTAATLTRTMSSPFAILVQERTGGPVSLAAALVVLAGVIGAIIVPPLLAALRLRGAATTGLAMGVAAHIVGTDAAGRRDPRSGAFAGAAMVLVGLAAALTLPWLWRWLLG